MRLLPMLMLALVILPSCNLSLGPVAERETVWAKMGTSGKVVGKCETEILVKVNGQEKRSKANIQGMMVVDQPTYEALLRCWQESRKAESEPEETPKTRL